MDAILFSARPSMVKVDDAIKHLSEHKELYWEVGFQIDRTKFSFPILGFIHIVANQVEYVATIKDIVSHDKRHYEDKKLASQIKPAVWVKEWEWEKENTQEYPFKYALIMAGIEPFSMDTLKFEKLGGGKVRRPPQGYTRVISPSLNDKRSGFSVQKTNSEIISNNSPSKPKKTIAERNLEEFVIFQLEKVEPGLTLIENQKRTPAGRLDLLCKDALGNYVVVELKRNLGTDQVVGQILRYMGWVHECYSTDKVRGIIIVGKKDQALSYAVKAVPNVQVKEFRLSIG